MALAWGRGWEMEKPSTPPQTAANTKPKDSDAMHCVKVSYISEPNPNNNNDEGQKDYNKYQPKR